MLLLEILFIAVDLVLFVPAFVFAAQVVLS